MRTCCFVRSNREYRSCFCIRNPFLFKNGIFTNCAYFRSYTTTRKRHHTTKQRRKMKIRVRPMNKSREMAYRSLKLVFFPRNKYISTEELSVWLKTKHVLNMGKIAKPDCSKYTIDNSFFLVDARRPDEYAFSHLKHALNMKSMLPSMEFMHKVNRDTPIVVYCTVGVRSGILTRRLNRLGFNNAMTLAGGMYGYVNNGLPLYTKEGEKKYKLVDKVVPQHWFASLLLKPDKIHIKQQENDKGILRGRLLPSIIRISCGAHAAWRSTKKYHEILRVQTERGESNRSRVFKLYSNKRKLTARKRNRFTHDIPDYRESNQLSKVISRK